MDRAKGLYKTGLLLVFEQQYFMGNHACVTHYYSMVLLSGHVKGNLQVEYIWIKVTAVLCAEKSRYSRNNVKA